MNEMADKLFNNKPNPRTKTEDGKTIHLARACAVVGEVFLYSTQDLTWYVLLGERGGGVPDYQGYWCLPCGYLDWDERLDEAVIREIWEETGLLLSNSLFLANIDKSFNLPSVESGRPKFLGCV